MNFILFAACGPFGICLWTLMGLGIFNKITRNTESKGIYYIHMCWRLPLVLLALYEGLQLIQQNLIHPLFVFPIAILFISIQMVTYYEAEAYFRHSVIKG
jgi:4-amino-4-deoxy-L-arabinose transferase-like glycosyltransferase